jgi:hypothetical protein
VQDWHLHPEIFSKDLSIYLSEADEIISALQLKGGDVFKKTQIFIISPKYTTSVSNAQKHFHISEVIIPA